MATVYIHIGAPKTATSTLQGVLANNDRKLLRHGVLYPRDSRHGDAHHLLVCDLIEQHQGVRMPDIWYGDKPRGQSWAALRSEMQRHAAEIDSVIISSELFFGQNKGIEAMLDTVSDHLGGHEVKVVVYLRRQDQLYSSFYNQDVKGVRQWPHSAYQFYQTHQMFRQDYHSMLNAWSSAFGKHNVLIRPFEQEQWLDGDILRDFCALTGTVQLTSTYRDQNESLGALQLYLKRCLNQVGYAKSDNDEVLRILQKMCPEEPLKGCSYVHKGLYRSYRSEWAKANRAISRDYLDGAPLFHSTIPRPRDLELYQIDAQALAAVIARATAELREGLYSDHRPLFARALLLALAEQGLWDLLPVDDSAVLLGWV